MASDWRIPPVAIEFSDEIEQLALSHDGELLLGLGHTLRLWSIDTGGAVPRARTILEPMLDRPRGIALFKAKSKTGRAAVATDKQLIFGAVRPRRSTGTSAKGGDAPDSTNSEHGWKRLHTLNYETAPVRRLAFTPDGQFLLAVTADAIEAKDFRSGEQIRDTVPLALDAAHDVALAAGPQLLAICTEQTLQLHSSVDGRLLRELPVLAGIGGVNTVALSPDGRLAAVGADTAIELVRTNNGEQIALVSGQNMGAQRLVFARDGRVLAALYDAQLRLWSVDGEELRLLGIVEGHTDQITDIAFTAAWQHFATASYDGTVRLWSFNEHHAGLTVRLAAPDRG